MKAGANDVSSDAAEAVNSNFDRHDSSVNLLRNGLKMGWVEP